MDNRKGLFFGAIIGDAFGSRYEFQSSEKAKQLLQKDGNQIYGLLGEGPFKLMPGQFTDDTELALALYYALKLVSFEKYSSTRVAHNYLQWYHSRPFDIGNTTRAAFLDAIDFKQVLQNSLKHNQQSLSNGCLMRIWSLVPFWRGVDGVNSMIDAATQDCQMTNPNRTAVQIVCAYCLMLDLLVKQVKPIEIVQRLQEFASSDKEPEPLLSILLDNIDGNSFVYQGKTFHLDRHDHDEGFIGKSFLIALKALLWTDPIHQLYFNGMTRIAAMGGDTDTNCCIAGAVLGARVGMSRLHHPWLVSVLTCKNPRVKDYPFVDLAQVFS